MRVVVGLDNVARMFAGWADGSPAPGSGWSRTRSTASRGAVIIVMALDVLDGRIQVIRSVNNPDKLHHLGPVADAWALLRGTPPQPGR